MTTPNPGSPEAVDAGCTCPIMDNGHGTLHPITIEHRGWVMRADCPLHGWEAEK